MTSFDGNKPRKTHALLTFLAALTFAGCGPIAIGSDKCEVSNCSGLATPESTLCSDGTKTTPTGACVKAADGACAWEVTSCAAMCKPGEAKPSGDGCNQCSCTASGEWACTDMACDTTCAYDGIRYADGTQFSSSKGCCQCSAGVVTCSTTDIACFNSCIYEGKTYPNGTTFPSIDGCNSCTCSNGAVGCTKMACPVPTPSCSYEGKTYASGATFPSIDGCNSCTCDSGALACTTKACADPTQCSDADCGAKPHSVPYQCSDGSTGGFTGQCLRDAAGVCNWEIHTCPSTCKEGEHSQSADGCQSCTCTNTGTWSCVVLDFAACGSTCTADGKEYPDGSTFASGGSCCGCTSGKVICQLTQISCDNACIYGDTLYTEWQSYPASDGCNTCVCKNGVNSCSQNTCSSSVCAIDECKGAQPAGMAYQCSDGSLAGPTGICVRSADGTCSWDNRTCATQCAPGEKAFSADGCSTCVCGDGGKFTCSQGQCPVCAEGDPRFIAGGCPACTVGADQTCNDDLTMSALAGRCIRNLCTCKDPFGLNPKNGKCKYMPDLTEPVCTPNVDQSCNGNLEVSSYQGRCLFDGTCECINDNVLDTTTGKCMRAKL